MYHAREQLSISLLNSIEQHFLGFKVYSFKINYLAETDTGSDLGSELESQLPDLETDSEYEVELKPDSESHYSEQESIYWPDGQKKTKICEQSEPWSELEFETESDEELNGMFS